MTEVPLPSFKNPPLDEVVLGVQFQPLRGFDVRHFGWFWERVRGRFPEFEVQPPLPPSLERFGQRRPTPHFKLEFAQPPLLPRVWMLSSEKGDLLQLQNDRLLRNWRRVDGDERYPRFDHVRSAFAQDLEAFELFVGEHRLGSIEPTQCEVTYVNQISAGARGSHPRDPAEVFATFASTPALASVADPEGYHSASTFIVRKTSGENSILARLFVEISSGIHTKTEEPLYVLNLTVRGVPASADAAGVLNFFDFARDRIVRTFASITTPELQLDWGREI